MLGACDRLRPASAVGPAASPAALGSAAMADTPLDLTLDAAALTARLVDFPSVSGEREGARRRRSRRRCAPCRT